jgi:hypothetical protein
VQQFDHGVGAGGGDLLAVITTTGDEPSLSARLMFEPVT